MTEFFKIEGVGLGFNGLIIESDGWTLVAQEETVPLDAGIETTYVRYRNVKTITDPFAMSGDRVVSSPVAGDALLISENHLKKTDDPRKIQFDSKNIFGKFIEEFRWKFDAMHLVAARYETALSVNLIEYSIEGHKTRFSHVFFKNAEFALKTLTDSVSRKEDPEDLIFVLQDLKNKE